MHRTLFALVGALALATTAMAQPGRHHDRPEPTEAAQRMSEHLGLDAETRETIESILVEAREEVQPLAERLKELSDELQASREESLEVDKRVRKLVKEIADVKSDLALLKMSTQAEIAALLTPEQAAKFTRMRMHHERGERRGPRGSLPEGIETL